jgi:hypothetical protein
MGIIGSRLAFEFSPTLADSHLALFIAIFVQLRLHIDQIREEF